MASSDSYSHITQVETQFPLTAHHIFNIIIEQTPPNTKLQISKAFWVKYCESLSNQVFPKLPCGSTEEAELTTSSDGKDHNVDIDDSNEDSDSRPNKIRKTSPYGNSEGANKTSLTPCVKIEPSSTSNNYDDKANKEVIEPSVNAEKFAKLVCEENTNDNQGTNNNQRSSSSGLSLASEAASKFISDNPYLQVNLRSSHVHGRRMYIPRAFGNLYFEKKAQTVTLWVGEKNWHVNLTVNKGSVGLEYRFSSGWAAFARGNCLQPSDLCIFELIQRNQPQMKQIPKAFWVKYCESLSSQVKLPCGSREEVGLTKSSDGKEHNVDIDDSNEDPDFSWFSKTRDKSPLPCSRPHKKRKTSPYGKSEDNISGESSLPRWKEPQNIMRKEMLTGKEKAEALTRAKGFKSDDPFFIVLMQPSFVGASYNMAIPFLFAKNHLRLSKHEDVILKVQDERIWPARYYYRKYKGCSQTRFEWGWKAFAIDNDLKVGDVCVFVKRKNIGILLFEVVTLYKNEVPNSSVLPAANNRTSCVKVEPSFTSNNYDKASMISHDIIAKKEVIEPSDKVCGESPVPEKFIRNQKLSRKDKAEAFQRVKDFKSEDPFFIVPMQPSSVGSKSRYNLVIPSFFVKKHLFSISSGPQDVILMVQDGRTWSAKYYVHVRPHGISSTFRIESGWKAFVQDNDLKVGDVCAFVFRKSIGRILFEVVIFHNNGVANSPMAMLPIPARPSKPKITPCVKVEPSFTTSMISEDLIVKKEIVETSVNKSDKVCGESPVPRKFIRNQEFSRKAKAEAFQRAKDFKSEDPFFIVAMQPSFVGSKSKYCMGVPSFFAKTYLISSSPQDVILKVQDGGTWCVKYHVRPLGVSSKATIESGWKAFVQDNNLKVGDVCVFVLRKSSGVILFEVVILHDNGLANSPIQQIPVSEENTGNQGTNNNKRPSSSGLGIASEAAMKFFSDNPYFQVKLKPYNVGGHAQVYIPLAYANPWFEKKPQTVTLWVGEDYWHVIVTLNKASNIGGLEYRFSAGWRAFARDNSLNPSDVCIFDLIKKNKPEIKQIPKTFWVKYCESLSSQAFLKLPRGSTWEVGLTKSSDGNVWMDKGWKAFAQHCSLSRGNNLVFRYEGNCRFNVIIFNKTMVEIDYPFDPNHNVDTKDDISVEVWGKSPLPCSQPHKRMKTSAYGKSEEEYK
ncbi:hypothetical protein G4B88_015794 [Cannabis sativa]|uniref:TF-B3 domain-containing protein n=1 Tax=Cannabis sativa TaxID=3483 RepID=A0A7J6G446_CANSA|nr:hypothetical protein G4B88_015794 [Cannabis sativa]